MPQCDASCTTNRDGQWITRRQGLDIGLQTGTDDDGHGNLGSGMRCGCASLAILWRGLQRALATPHGLLWLMPKKRARGDAFEAIEGDFD